MLRHAHAAGQWAALVKLGLNNGTQTNEIDGGIERGQDIPWDRTLETKTPNACLNSVKAAALGLKDMLFFENMMGPDEAHNMFNDIHKQMTGQGGGFRGSLQIGPGGVQRIPQPPAPPAAAMAPRPMATPPPIPPAALRPRLGVK